jgi:acetyl esterase
LRENGVECDLQVLPGAPHRLSEWVKFSPDYAAQYVAWLDRHLRPETAAVQATTK